jgi:hypothetical protein
MDKIFIINKHINCVTKDFPAGGFAICSIKITEILLVNILPGNTMIQERYKILSPFSMASPDIED